MLPKLESPTFKVKIPSMEQEVTMRCMKVKEEKILLMAKEGGDYGEILSSVKQVVQNCVVEPKTNVDDLAIFDIEYLFLKLRARSVSETTEVAYIDNDEVATAMGDSADQVKLQVEQRKATYSFTIKLDDVVVQFPEKTEKEIKISDTAGIVLRYPPAALYSDKEFMNASGEKLVDLLIQKSIQTIYDGKDVKNFGGVFTGAEAAIRRAREQEELSVWINDLDIKTYNKIRSFFNDLPHLNYEIKYTNKNGKDRTISLTNLNDFFTLA